MLHPDTTYTAWLPLKFSSEDATPKYGSIRLRYRVHWVSNAKRALGYLAPPPAARTACSW